MRPNEGQRWLLSCHSHTNWELTFFIGCCLWVYVDSYDGSGILDLSSCKLQLAKAVSVVVSRSAEGTCRSRCGCLWAARARRGGVLTYFSASHSPPSPSPSPHRLPSRHAPALLPIVGRWEQWQRWLSDTLGQSHSVQADDNPAMVVRFLKMR
jgi:hypothetical protein